MISPVTQSFGWDLVWMEVLIYTSILVVVVLIFILYDAKGGRD